MIKKFKGEIAVYVLLMLGMAIGLYLMGFSSVAFASFTDYENDDGSIDVGQVFTKIAEEIAAALTEFAIVGPIIGFTFLTSIIGGGNYSTGTILSYIIPILIVYVVVNLLFFPVVPIITSESHGTPVMGEVTLLLSLVFNTMLFLAILEYSSGRK